MSGLSIDKIMEAARLAGLDTSDKRSFERLASKAKELAAQPRGQIASWLAAGEYHKIVMLAASQLKETDAGYKVSGGMNPIKADDRSSIERYLAGLPADQAEAMREHLARPKEERLAEAHANSQPVLRQQFLAEVNQKAVVARNGIRVTSQAADAIAKRWKDAGLIDVSISAQDIGQQLPTGSGKSDQDVIAFAQQRRNTRWLDGGEA